MDAARAAEFTNLGGGIPRVEQQGVDLFGSFQGEIDRLRIADMDDLNDARGRYASAKGVVDVGMDLVVDELNRVHAGSQDVIDDGVRLAAIL